MNKRKAARSTKDDYGQSMEGFSVIGHKGGLTKWTFILKVQISGNPAKKIFKPNYLNRNHEKKYIVEEAVMKFLASTEFSSSPNNKPHIRTAYLNFIQNLYGL